MCHIEGSRDKYLFEYSFYCLSLQYGSNSFSGRARARRHCPLFPRAPAPNHLWSGVNALGQRFRSGSSRVPARSRHSRRFSIFRSSFIHRRSSRRSSHTATSNTTRSVCVEYVVLYHPFINTQLSPFRCNSPSVTSEATRTCVAPAARTPHRPTSRPTSHTTCAACLLRRRCGPAKRRSSAL